MTSNATTKENNAKKTILFVAEAVTLAHFGRMMTLARSLDPERYNVVIASDPRYLSLEQTFTSDFEPIWTIPSEQFAQALAKGKAVYSASTLTRYIEDDVQLLEKIKPDLVVGDFRLSLAVSAPLAGVPYAAVVNAYWSPFANISYPVPDLPFTKVLGLALSQKVFNAVRPLAFTLHARPLNTLRRRHKLTPIGNDLCKVYTWANHTLYADIPELVPCEELPANHHYLGPVLWSTQTDLPPWWDKLPRDKPIVFVSPGSSGQIDLLGLVLEAICDLPINIIAATAGRVDLAPQTDNVFAADYLPFEKVAQLASLVICNGGSLTTYQALAEAVPILGLTTNLDQLLNMQAIEQLGVGICLRQSMAGKQDVYQATRALLDKPHYAEAAERMAAVVTQYNAEQRFATLLDKILL
jgi:UDP:flavonoid glycosyltransferase YjiC (YdhE family)